MTILCYFKKSLVTFVQRITLKSMFSKKAYKSVARVPCVCSIYRGNYDFVSFVETWLQGHIHDNVVDIQGYNLIRRDRCERQHGGVCIYIKDTIEFSVLDELFDSLFEVLWINMRLTRPVNSNKTGTITQVNMPILA